MHEASLPVGDREESPERYTIKWGGLVVDIWPEKDEDRVCINVRHKTEDWCLVVKPDDVDRVVTTTPYFLPEVFKEVNEALRVCARIVRG